MEFIKICQAKHITSVVYTNAMHSDRKCVCVFYLCEPKPSHCKTFNQFELVGQRVRSCVVQIHVDYISHIDHI